MAEQPSRTGPYMLVFLTVFNLAAFVCLSVYHIQLVQDLETKTVDHSRRMLKQLLADVRSDVTFRRRRGADGGHTNQSDDLYFALDELKHIQPDLPCNSTSLKELLVKILTNEIGVTNDGFPKNGREVRQTSAAGNELAQIFSEIAKSEIDILNKYCTNGSTVCMPGAKGDPGMQGVPGAQGVSGPAGAKGDTGNAGPFGPKGDRGASGAPGIKGDAGPPGTKGDPGNSGGSGIPLTPGTSCCQNLAPPAFTQHVQEIRVTENSDITLNCDVSSGYPPPRLTWTPSPSTFDVVRTRFGPSVITIKNSTVSDSNLYKCVANNVLGDSEKQFNVHVYQHISFEEQPHNATVMMGTSATLECKIDGPLNSTISWFRVMPDGSRLAITTNITPIQHGSQLHVDHMSRAKEGHYICEGHNGVEHVSKSAYIAVYGPPHIRPPGTVTAVKGDHVRLRCVADAHPPATFTWTYPPGVTNAYADSDGSLVILHAQPKHSENFVCTARNRYGEDRATLTLKVGAPPEVTILPTRVPAALGSNIPIECKPSGDPPLTVGWAKDGVPVTSNGHLFVLPGNVLLISQTAAPDYGTYTCTALNSMGVAHASSYVYQDQGTITCTDTFSMCLETTCGATCPANCAGDPTAVYGVDNYQLDSSICKAGMQAGVVTDSGGQIVWVISHNVTSFTAGTRNGVKSLAHFG